MYAIVEIAGHQYKVEKDQKLYVNRLEAKVGEAIQLSPVLLTDDGDHISVGAPAIAGVSVSAKVLEHLKADKKIVFKKKRRKGYQKKNGHRQPMTRIEICALNFQRADKKPAAAQATAQKADKPKAASPKPAVAKATTVKPKSDDLKKIEGIGPKIAEILTAAGIDSFAKLAKADVARLKEILNEAGSRYASRNPTSWPEQATLAAKADWDALKTLRERLRDAAEN